MRSGSFPVPERTDYESLFNGENKNTGNTDERIRNRTRSAETTVAEPENRTETDAAQAISFLEIANAAIDRGLSVIPILPKKKTVCGQLAKNGAKSRTRNRDLVAAWADEEPNANVGICADDETTILESDDEPRFRQLVREVSQKLFGVSRELPRTLTSQARKNRPHFFYKNTSNTRKHTDSPGIAGLYEWRHSNQYVVGFGSIHPLGMPYRIIVDTEIVPMPDWLVEVLEEIKKAYRGQSSAASSFVKVGPAGSVIEALTAKYLLDPKALLADPEFRLEVSSGERHYFLTSIAGLLHDGERTTDEVFELLREFRDAYCVASTDKSDDEVQRIADWVIKRKPCVPNDSFLPVGELKAETIDLSEIEEITNPIPRYPIEIWDNTMYAEFADICREGNNIPPEFFIEALKTVVGAVVGNALELSGVEGGLSRFYTVLINSGSSGKGTAIKYACRVFQQKDQPLLWSPVVQIDTVKWKSIGACTAAFSSAPGMQRLAAKGQTRWLQVHEELSSVIESTGIQGSGQTLLAALRQLYDGEAFLTMGTGTRDPAAGQAQNTMLCGTTPTLWADMFSGKSVEGSGLFQRFNIIVAGDIKRVGSLLTPDLTEFSERMVEKVARLQESPVRLTATPDAIKLMNDWFEKVSAPVDGEERDPDEYGRINVLGWRNAIHLAWLEGRKEISKHDVARVLKLCEYQLKVREYTKPSSGVNHTALIEDKIRRLVQAKGKVGLREARKRLHVDRYGLTAWDRALRNLLAVQDIRLIEEGTMSGQSKKWLVRAEK